LFVLQSHLLVAIFCNLVGGCLPNADDTEVRAAICLKKLWQAGSNARSHAHWAAVERDPAREKQVAGGGGRRKIGDRVDLACALERAEEGDGVAQVTGRWPFCWKRMDAGCVGSRIDGGDGAKVAVVGEEANGRLPARRPNVLVAGVLSASPTPPIGEHDPFGRGRREAHISRSRRRHPPAPSPYRRACRRRRPRQYPSGSRAPAAGRQTLMRVLLATGLAACMRR
jgi:hypothetical protein